MKLFVEPNFESETIDCIQELKLQCLKDLSEPVTQLDSVGLDIKKILYRESENIDAVEELSFVYSDKGISIKLPKPIKKDSYFHLQVRYSAHPKKGFHFVIPNKYHPEKDVQAWTQGQMIESRYWFPCLDDPQIKYPREVSVSVPSEFLVISNGKLEGATSSTDPKKKTYSWKEDNPQSTYLTSIVIGKFAEIIEHYEHRIDLLYYVPKDKIDRVRRSFKETAEIMKFFESYFDTSYPYSKYAQTTVQDFEYGGMENTSCTTLPEEILLDEKASFDDFPSTIYNSTRSVVTHELAHQWFGDLVTCKDWAHIWLNEGFATYCEALYIESADGKDEFQRYMELLGVLYFSEACGNYRRSVVTSKYKYPDELFDLHSYKKGAWILHMLRAIMGNDVFKIGLKRYLETFRGSVVESKDLRNVMEQVSGENLEQFFKQWVHSKGHPELQIQFIEDKNLIKIIQLRRPFFDFRLEIRIVMPDSAALPNVSEFLIKAQEENIIEIPVSREKDNSNRIQWFSLDPELKVLKRIWWSESSIPSSMILNQISNGYTIIERRQALDAIDYKKISEENLEEKLIQILKDRILNDDYYGVSSKAASKLGLINSDNALDALLECLDSIMIEEKQSNREVIRRWIINSIGEYIPNLDDDKMAGVINKLENIIRKGSKSYYVESEVLKALGGYVHERSFRLLCDAIERPNTFNDVIPTAAIDGLARMSAKAIEDIRSENIKEDKKLELEILADKGVDILIRKTQDWNSNNVRTIAIDSLKMFLLENNSGEINKIIFKVLFSSLDDKWPQVRRTALAIFENTFSPDDKYFEPEIVDRVIDKIQKMAETDLSLEVRRNAELCLMAIRGRQVAKVRAVMKTRQDMSKYVSDNVATRTMQAFGSTLKLQNATA